MELCQGGLADKGDLPVAERDQVLHHQRGAVEVVHVHIDHVLFIRNLGRGDEGHARGVQRVG